MDKNEFIDEHSAEKLLVYEKYLKRYLLVLCNSKYFNEINIWEPFAGKGKDRQGTRGSALLAAKIIKDSIDKYRKKIITLFLNDLDRDYCDSLQKEIIDNGYEDFCKVSNYDAKDFLNKVLSELGRKSNTHNLFFIDPHGYTQYSKENLFRLLMLKNSECLIFLPTSFIYRFLWSERKSSPAITFLSDFGVDLYSKKFTRDNINAIINDIIKDIIVIFKEIAQTRFSYSYEVKNKKGSIFHLCFITKHPSGAKKFLETLDSVKNELVGDQLILFDDDKYGLKEDLSNFFQLGRKSNVDIYYKSIELGFYRKIPIIKILQELLDDNLIDIDYVRGEENKKRSKISINEKNIEFHISWKR